MKYIGVDLHRDFFVAVAQDNLGTELFKKRYNNTVESIEQLLSEFSEPPMVVVEATRNWMWFIAALQEKGCIVQLAHPFRTKASPPSQGSEFYLKRNLLGGGDRF